ncbi:MAG: tetratricopeptide repeat protein [Pseudomonadota bacterium]
MQISRTDIFGLIAGAGLAIVLAFAPAHAFDVRSSFAPDAASEDIFKFGFNAFKNGRQKEGVEALKYAAEKGHPGSQWKLGRMYSQGDGVPRNPAEAFRLFAAVADQHADARPGSPTASYVASSFVALGHFYEMGSEEASITVNRRQARRLYEHAAFYFDDANAQYQLARFHLDSEKVTRGTRRQAIRSLALAARKGHPKAAARLGSMLIEGEHIRRDVVQGLKFLTVALRHAGTADRATIQSAQEHAFSMASEEQRRQAVALAQSEFGQ